MAGRFDLVFRAPRVVTAAGEMAGCVAVRDGRVAAIEPLAAGQAGERTITLGEDEALLPGLVDIHVHVNEPGRTDWEGFASATRAAAAGGITTILDMPLNSVPPTVDVAALQAKREAAEGQVHVDVGFWGGAVPGNWVSCAASTTPACSASSASCSPPGWRSSPTWARPSSTATWRSWPPSRRCCWCTPRTPRRWRGRPRPTAGATPTSSGRDPARPRTWPWPR